MSDHSGHPCGIPGCVNASPAAHSPFEQDIKEPRRLVMEYNVRCRYEVVITPGCGAVSRGMYDAISGIAGQANVDPASVSFRLEQP